MKGVADMIPVFRVRATDSKSLHRCQPAPFSPIEPADPGCPPLSSFGFVGLGKDQL